MSTDSPPSDNTPPSSAGPSSPSTVRSPSTLSHAGSLSHALRQAQIGLSNGYQPSLSKAGTGGAYFLKRRPMKTLLRGSLLRRITRLQCPQRRARRDVTHDPVVLVHSQR